MSFSNEFRYRNLGSVRSGYRRPRYPNYTVLLVITTFLIVCCGCLGVVVGLQLSGKPLPNPLASANPIGSSPKATVATKATATPNLKGEVPLKSRGLNENGLEMTVNGFERPLQVQGLTRLAADQQFVLVSVLFHNTKTSGQPIGLDPTNFKLKGDGGLTYDANPKIVTIENLLMVQDQVAPGKDLERELIFQIAKDDAYLKLYWTVGKTTRIFTLEPEK